MWRWLVLMVAVGASFSVAAAQEVEPRKPASDAELRFWLENMAWHHRYSRAEMATATGLAEKDVTAALARFDIHDDTRPKRRPDDPLLVLPYPGGRHPRIGFLDGAVRPQRETKVSVFTPWDPASYVVVDVPEAVWSNLGLTYLAHTHVPTIWSKAGVTLPPLEWERRKDGSFDATRKLPNGITFRTVVRPTRSAVRMEMTLVNGTKDRLSDLRVQQCVMLKGAAGFTAQTNDNKVFAKPYVACKDEKGTRWIVTAWTPCQRAWGNPPCPCLHSDPQFPDCEPGKSQTVRGWLSFYEGTDIDAELKRIEALGWSREEVPPYAEKTAKP